MTEHTADRRAIYVPSIHTKANNSARVLIHDDHDPVRLQCNGFGTEQVDRSGVQAPQTVLGMSESSQPGWPRVTGFWFVVDGEYASDNVLVDIEPESQVDLLSDTGAAVPWVALFHLHNGAESLPRCIGYDFLCRSFGSGLSAATI